MATDDLRRLASKRLGTHKGAKEVGGVISDNQL